MYDAADRRFMAMDPVKGSIAEPQSLVLYVYCLDAPLFWVDPRGLEKIVVSGSNAVISTVSMFIELAIKAIREWLSKGDVNESITWLVANSGYDSLQLAFLGVLLRLKNDYPDSFTDQDDGLRGVLTLKDGIHKLTLKMLKNKRTTDQRGHDHGL